MLNLMLGYNYIYGIVKNFDKLLFRKPTKLKLQFYDKQFNYKEFQTIASAKYRRLPSFRIRF